MRIKSKRLLAVAVAGALSVAGTACATNGYFSIGYGAGQVGMGGVGVTAPQDSMCVGGNPACLGEFERPQFDVGTGLFDARRRSGTNLFDQSPSNSNTWSGVNSFIIPGMGFVFPFNDELVFGFAMLGNGGMDTTYKPNFFDSYIGDVRSSEYLNIDMMQLLMPITVAYRLDKQNTFGVSIVPARARFKATGLQSFIGLKVADFDPEHLTDKGHDYSNGLGARIGWTGHYLNNQVTLGVTWASKVYMHKFDLYRGLFAGAGSFDIPENYAVGIAVKPREDLTVALDIQKILYSDIPSVANPGLGPLGFGRPSNTIPQLGTPGGLGFGWKDMTIYKLGVAYKYNDNWTFRAGYNYGKSPIPDSELLFNLLAPGTTEKHLTVGTTYNLGEQSIFGFGSEGALTLAFQHAVKHSQSGMVDQTHFGEFVMFQNELEIAYTLKF
jgi:long-chain fatty acid transport protein